MKQEKKDGIFSLIETHVTTYDIKESDSETVYSLLALYPEDDFANSEFIYDIAREKDLADYVLSALKVKKPSKEALLDTVAEML